MNRARSCDSTLDPDVALELLPEAAVSRPTLSTVVSASPAKP